MDNDNIIVQTSDVEAAQIICGSIQDDNKRNRAVANVIAAKIAAGFFNPDEYNVDIDTGLHNFAKILNDIDISDIYVNDSFVDVRVYFSEDEICVPKIHFDYGITPVVYMFIKLKRNLSGGTVTGFISPRNVNQDNLKDDYFYIKESDLSSFYDIENCFQKVLDTYKDSNEKIYEYLDDSLNINDLIQLLRTFIASKTARMALLNISKAQSIFNFVSVPEEKFEVINDDLTNEVQEDDFQEVSDADSLFQALEYSTEVTGNEEYDFNEHNETYKNGMEGEDDQIDNLFTGEQEGIPDSAKKKSNAIIPLLIMVMIACIGYVGYIYGYPWYLANYGQNANNNDIAQEQISPIGMPEQKIESEQQKQEDAMPNEQVEAPQTAENKEEGNQVSIPAIEKHLDASVLVANLKVDWEVPEGYITNTASKYYFVKLGKIIQLNLKSELLLLTKPPLSNRIALELKYNSNSGKFDIIGFQTSSGEKSVDDVIMRTVQSSLSTKIGTSTESFAKAQGNPVIVIHL